MSFDFVKPQLLKLKVLIWQENPLLETICRFDDGTTLPGMSLQVVVVRVIEVDDQRDIRQTTLLFAQPTSNALAQGYFRLATAGENNHTHARHVHTHVQDRGSNQALDLASLER